jgi:hypothetical protein
MFDLFFTATGAFNQAMLILGALLCIGLGGLLLGHEIYWRLRALRVEGTIVGVREKSKNMFNSVYRYSLPTGQSFEATSNEGSSSARGRETGSRVQLLVFADKPEDVCEAGSSVWEIVGGILILVGFWPLHTALTAWPVTPLTWVMLSVACIYGAHRLGIPLIPGAERKSLTEWQRARRDKGRAELAGIPVRPIEEIVSSPDAVEQRRNQQKTSRIATPIVLLAGLGALAFGLHLGRGIARLQALGARTEGTVVGLQHDGGSDNGSYYPIVRFVADGGARVEFKDSLGSNPPSHRAGERVAVLYRKDAPQRDAIIDQGIWNWVPAVLLGVFGTFLSGVSIRALVNRRNDENHRKDEA